MESELNPELTAIAFIYASQALMNLDGTLASEWRDRLIAKANKDFQGKSPDQIESFIAIHYPTLNQQLS